MPWRHIRIVRFGGPETLELAEEATVPEPGPNEVRIRVLAAGTGFTDTFIRRGRYPDFKGPLPFTPGYDLVGVVEQTGRDVLLSTRLWPLPSGRPPHSTAGISPSFLRTSMRSAEHSLRTCARYRRDGNTKGAREGTGFTTATGRDRFWRSSERVDRLAAQFVGAIGGCVVIVETTDDAHALALQRFSPGVRR